MDKLEKAISILSDDFSFDENGIMKITREAVNEIVELMKEQQEEIKRLKSEKARAIESIESEINRLHKESKYVKDEAGTATYEWLINGYQSSLDMIKDGDGE